MIRFIHNEDLIYHIFEYDVILIGTTINNTFGNGFQKEIERSFWDVAKCNSETIYGDRSKFGTCLIVDGKPKFCICYIFDKRNRPYDKPDVLNYDALSKCLERVNESFIGKNIASTFIGTSEFDGGGDKNRVSEIINKKLTNVNLTIYDYKQPNYRIEDSKKFKNIVSRKKNGEITNDEYYELKKKYIWEIAHGYYEKVPDGLTYNELKQYIKNEKQGRNN